MKTGRKALNRREFLKASGAVAAATLTGCRVIGNRGRADLVLLNG